MENHNFQFGKSSYGWAMASVANCYTSWLVPIVVLLTACFFPATVTMFPHYLLHSSLLPHPSSIIYSIIIGFTTYNIDIYPSIYKYIYMHIITYTHTHIYIYIHTFIYLYIYIYIFSLTHIYLHLCIFPAHRDPRSAAKPHGGAGHGSLVPWRRPDLRRSAGRGGGGVAGATGRRGGAAATGGGRSWGCCGVAGGGGLGGLGDGSRFQFLELVFCFSEVESDF